MQEVALDVTLLRDHPFWLWLVSFLVMVAAVHIGGSIRGSCRWLKSQEPQFINLTLTSTLTLVAVLLGFSLSMAVERYDQRRATEATEANAIGTEYSRLNLLAPEIAAGARGLMTRYARLRIEFYTSRDATAPERNDRDTAALQEQMLGVVYKAASVQPNSISPLIVSGMNSVVDAQGFALAAWKNRLPFEVWLLLLAAALGASILIGLDSGQRAARITWAIPQSFSIAFLLIADIDSPRHGMVVIEPQNLVAFVNATDLLR